MTSKLFSTLLEAHEFLKTKLRLDLTHSVANALISIVKAFLFLLATFPTPENGTGYTARVFTIAKATHVVLW